MISGLQSAASGMVAQMAGQDTTSNNLANANTPGFKRDVTCFSSIYSGQLMGKHAAAVGVMGACDSSQGTFQETGNPLHLALDGEGYFMVQTSDGPTCTRNGSFTLRADGTLVTSSGDPVLGNSGPIRLGPGEVKIDERGRIFQKGKQVDALEIVRPASTSAMRKMGSGLTDASGAIPLAASEVRVRQGSLESSNVNAIGEMVSMIAGLRAYEAGQKAIQAQDETLQKLVNDVGRLR